MGKSALTKVFTSEHINYHLQSGLDHIDKIVFPHYLEKSFLTTVDKKNVMSVILQMISLTTLPSSISTPVRMVIYEVREGGIFSILAAYNIGTHRLDILETLLSHRTDKPSSILGYAVSLRKTVKINNIEHPPAKYRNVYMPMIDNNESIPLNKSRSILAIPIFEDLAQLPDSKILAVLSISASKTSHFSNSHKRDLEKYCDRIRDLLIYFNKTIKMDPIAIKNVRIITISGQSGAGKTTLMNELFKYLGPLGWRKIQIGKLFRDFCTAHHYSIEDVEKIHPEVRHEFNNLQREILETESNIILEGRMSGYWGYKTGLVDIVKIFCDLPLDARVQRFAEREAESLTAAKVKVAERDNKDLTIYNELYGVENYRESKYYNLYLDTTKTPDELAKIVFTELSKSNNK